MHHNFETTYRTVDGRVVKGGLAFDLPRHAKHGVLVTRGGSQISREDWPKMKRTLTFDELASPNMSSGPKKPFNPLATSARSDLHSAVKRFCDALGLEHEKVGGAVSDILEQHEAEAAQAHAQSFGAGTGKGAGASALDDDDEVDLDELDQKVKQYLEGHGLDPVSVKQALEIMRRDRAAAAVSDDELPNNRFGNGPPIKRRLETDAELETDYPGSAAVMYDPMGSQPSNMSPDPVKRLSERAVARIAGGGVGRRLQTPPGAGDAALRASDADLAKEYPGIENVVAGY